MRPARLASSLCDSAGTSSTTARNVRWLSTSNVQSVSQVAVAVRGPWSSSDSSPTMLPGPRRGDLLAVALHRDRAVEDDERLATHLPLIDDQRPGRHRDLVTGLRDLLQVLLRERLEHRDVAEVFEVRLFAGHGGRL